METLVRYGQIINSLFESFNKGDIQQIINRLDHDCIWESMGQPEVPYAGIYHGPEDVSKFFKKLNDAMEISACVPEHILENGRLVIATGYLNATGRKSGKHFSTIWSMSYEFNDNEQIVHFRDCYDTLATARALNK